MPTVKLSNSRSAGGLTSNEVSPAFDSPPLPRVIFGAGSLAKLGELTRDLGCQRVLLVTDPGLEAAGHPQRAQAILKSAGLSVVVFDGVEENPTDKHVHACLRVAQEHQIDGFVAVGGGSSMDCAKGTNFLLTNGGKMSDYKGYGKAKLPMLPSIGVPTTSGTGSEAQSYALIADEKSHIKMACGDRKAAFRVALLDPEVTLSQPRKVTALTGIDALAHALESYVTLRRNLISQTYAKEAWRLLESNLEVVLQQPDNLAARSSVQLGAFLAGAAIENSMLGACHACANPLTAHYGLTHGAAIGTLLPHVVRYNSTVVGPLYNELAQQVGLLNGHPGAGADALAKRITDLLQIADLPTTLSAHGISKGILPVLADEAAEQWTSKFNPRPVGHAELLQIYEKAY